MDLLQVNTGSFTFATLVAFCPFSFRLAHIFAEKTPTVYYFRPGTSLSPLERTNLY